MNLIVAFDQNYIIGDKNKLPWKVPEDLAFFKETTESHIVIMGRKTFESLPSPLKSRINIVITNSQDTPTDTSSVYYRSMHSVFPLLDELSITYPEKKVFVIGGSQIYDAFFSYINTFYFTKIYREGNNGDTFLPDRIREELNSLRYIKKTVISKRRSSVQQYEYEVFIYFLRQ